MKGRFLLAVLLWLAALAAGAQAADANPNVRARELQVLREGEAKFSQSLSDFNRLLKENPERGTSARTRLQQLAVQLDDAARELKSRYDFESRYPQNKDELAHLTRPWEKFLSDRSAAVTDLIRDGREAARTSSGQPVRGPAPKGEADIDLEKLSRDIGVPLGPPVARGSPDALPIPPKPQNPATPDTAARQTPPVAQAQPAPPPSAAGNVYFAVLSPAYRTTDDEWKVPECRFREVAKTRTNYGSRTEAEGDAARIRSMGYADAEPRYFDTWQRLDEFTRDWAARRASDSKRCSDAYALAKQRKAQ